MSVTGSIIAGVGAAGAIGGAAISANAAGNASSAQANSANYGANLQYQLGNENLDLQQAIFNEQQANQKPFLEAGQNAISTIDFLNGQKPLSAAPAASQPPINVPSLAASNTAPTNTRAGMNLVPGQDPNRPIPLARGGWTMPLYHDAATHYIVGERGPEKLDMYPGGVGMVTPMKQPMGVHDFMRIPRAGGGPVLNDPGVLQTPGGNTANQPGAHTSPLPVNAPVSNVSDPNSLNDANNPLVTGGSPWGTPSQNVPFQNWTQQFVAPTLQQAEQEPGFKFTEQQGDQALLNQASAAGTTGSTATAAALDQYNQDLASTTYNNVYGRALQGFQQNYNIFENNQQNQWNRLASTAGIGTTAAGQLNSAASNFGANAGSTLLNTGYNVANLTNAAAAARASGYVGTANAWGGALGNIGNSATLPLYLSMLQQNGNPYAGVGGNAASAQDYAAGAGLGG